MKCSNCGKESTQDMKFCGYCGKMIKPVEVELEQNAEKEPAEVALTENKPSEPKKKTVTEKIKDKFLQFWHRIDLLLFSFLRNLWHFPYLKAKVGDFVLNCQKLQFL